MYSGTGKSQPSFPTGTVDPRGGITLSPLNTNDGFSFSIIWYHKFKAYQVLMASLRYKETNDLAGQLGWALVTGRFGPEPFRH